MVGRLILLALLLIPVIEIALFVEIGRAVGLVPTLGGIIVIAIIGTLVIRHQGLALLAEIRTSINRSQLPARALADAMLVTIAGVLMVVPGYFTDCLGLLLLIPPLRAALYWFLARRLGLTPTTGGGAPPTGPRLIELEVDEFRPR
jgi:UPF0716 protein FxsA